MLIRQFRSVASRCTARWHDSRRASQSDICCCQAEEGQSCRFNQSRSHEESTDDHHWRLDIAQFIDIPSLFITSSPSISDVVGSFTDRFVFVLCVASLSTGPTEHTEASPANSNIQPIDAAASHSQDFTRLLSSQVHRSNSRAVRSSPISSLFSFPLGPHSSRPRSARMFHSDSSSSSSDSPSPSGLTHLNASNQPSMVDVSHKNSTQRIATARSLMFFPPIFQSIFPPENTNHSHTPASPAQRLEVSTPKGPVFATAIIAGTQAVKKTSDLIPFCHPLPVESIKFLLSRVSAPANTSNMPSDGIWIEIQCSVKVSGKTGVEMEALTGASVAALTVYDMCKAKSHDIVIWRTELVRKEGGKSGVFVKQVE